MGARRDAGGQARQRRSRRGGCHRGDWLEASRHEGWRLSGMIDQLAVAETIEHDQHHSARP